tara:strand:+ start:89 stop:265 length:177 start_codon:yes stop_codon:yes gene_type:complete
MTADQALKYPHMAAMLEKRPAGYVRKPQPMPTYQKHMTPPAWIDALPAQKYTDNTLPF